MEFIKGFVFVIYIITCLVLIVLALMQSGEDEGASGTIVGGAASSFYGKNKGRTKEGVLKKWTIIFGIVFIVLTLVEGFLYML